MVAMEPTPELQDPVLLAEIDLLCDLIEAVAHANGPLTKSEIDDALRVGDDSVSAHHTVDTRDFSVA
jgi:hypothetical protein